MELQNTVNSIERKHLLYLKLNLIGFVLWYGIMIIQEHLETPTYLKLILMIISLTGGVIWMITLVKLTKLGKLINGKPLLKAIFSDDLFKANKDKAIKVTLVVLMVLQVVFHSITSFLMDISGAFIVKMNILVGMMIATGSFIFFQTKENA